MSSTTSIPAGTRDFSPSEISKRNYIFNTIRNIFELYGFMPIETPAMETLSTLLGKYGEEGDKLIFRILNSGDYLKGIPQEEIKEENTIALSSKICEKGLRYDLTVPFARFVVQHRNEIIFPFKRYQIQPVWRAEKNQKGRYREFYQCDIDVVGSNSLLNEAEIVQIIDKVFGKLGIQVVVKLNSRKILAGIAEIIGETNKITDITVAIDKLDKIGIDKVKEELASKNISEKSIQALQPLLEMKGDNLEKLQSLKKILASSEIGVKGISEVETILASTRNMEIRNTVEADICLARGLDYYTGAIFEVKAKDVSIGSICGGGRYDNLTGIFGLEGVSGVGVSFGADRIYDVLSQLDKFPLEIALTTRVLFANFGEKEVSFCVSLASKLRDKGISCEIYPDVQKIRKQMSYADSRKIPYVALAGEDEIAQNSVTLKDMKTGEQKKLSVDEFIETVGK